MNSGKTLYLCYFGLREPLVQTQVLPYLRELKKDGVKIFLLTFEQNPKENWTTEQIAETRKDLENEGIFWSFLTYHRRPAAISTFFDIFNGAQFAWRLNRRERLDIYHGRVHTPTMMGALANKFSFGHKPKLLFDIRGFFPEEYVDGGVWKESDLIFRIIKKTEKWLMKESDGFVVLTEKARNFLFPESKTTSLEKNGRPVEVIPCCVDYSRLKNSGEHSKKKSFELIYAGSVTGLYLAKEMGELFLQLKKRKPDAFFRILTSNPPESVKATFDKLEIKPSDYKVEKVKAADVFYYLQNADLAVSFRKPSFAQIAASPTKIPEYLAAGLPVISNSGIGDFDDLIENEGVGAIMREFTEKSYNEALNTIENLQKSANFSVNCRRTAEKFFDLETVGGAKYRHIYKRLLQM